MPQEQAERSSTPDRGSSPPALRPDLRAELALQSRACGFAKLGVCRPDAIPEAPERLVAFVTDGRHGDMGWMAERMAWRGDPRALWPQARSIVMLADAYTPSHDPLAVLREPHKGAISVYAQGKDYHDTIKPRLKRLARWLVAQQPGVEVKVFVDTAPVMEKPLAQAAGLGWQGKHTNLLGRSLGNWVFLGAIFTTLELPPDAPEADHCGTCRACLDICPTGAFPAPYQMDARRCISYLTIEHKGSIAPELRPLLGNRIYGCDDCLAVCPWNKFAVAATEMRYLGTGAAPDLAALASLDDVAFRARFAGTPVKRIGRDRFLRNVLYSIGNSGEPGLIPVARMHRDAADPVVADAAEWAERRLSGAD